MGGYKDRRDRLKTLSIKFYGLKLGKIIITTRNQIKNADVSATIDGKTIWDLFKRAVKEKKIILPQ